MSEDDFGEKLKNYVLGNITEKAPIVWGTCSGLIMLAKNLENQKTGGQYHVSVIFSDWIGHYNLVINFQFQLVNIIRFCFNEPIKNHRNTPFHA